MDTFLRLILLQDANTRVVLLGAALLGMTSGVIGSFAVLRRRALLGDALAHAALPGICTAYFVVGDKSFTAFLIGALIFGTLGVLCVSFVSNHATTPPRLASNRRASRHACKYTSSVTSSASAGLPKIRDTSECTREAVWSYSAAKAS